MRYTVQSLIGTPFTWMAASLPGRARMPTDPWTPDRLIPWDPDPDGKDSEQGDDLDDEEVNPEDSPLWGGVHYVGPEEMAARAARLWRCDGCGRELQSSDWRMPVACWDCGGKSFTVVGTTQPRPDSDRC
jgi:DNA-directed RNA polymerase subunit RPC12/RpoP